MDGNSVAKNTLKIKGRTKYDWDMLKKEFFESNFLEAKTFLRWRLGGKKGLTTNMEKHIKGWTKEKREWKRKIIEKALAEIENDLVEKAKITIEDLLLHKKIIFALDNKYLHILAKIADNKPLDKSELDFLKQYKVSLKEIYKRIQAELGEPTKVETSK